MANKIQMIAAGDIGEGVKEWLEARGARWGGDMGLIVIELPANLRLERGPVDRRWDCSIMSYVNGDPEDEWVSMEHYENAWETRLRLEKE